MLVYTTCLSLFMASFPLALLLAGEEDTQKKKLFSDYSAMEGEILFFGKVVDQYGKPIEGASVMVSVPTPASWAKPIMIDREKSLMTDERGLFEVSQRTYSVLSLKGVYLYVKRMAKDGYEGDWIRDAHGSFCYSTSNSQRFIPDRSNPIIYTLRKKEKGAFLLNVVELDFETPVEKSGQTKGYDFIKHHRIKDIQNFIFNDEPVFSDIMVKATFNTNDTTWTAVISSGDTNGGVIVSEQLLYEAPQDGYQKECSFVPNDGRLKNPLYIYLESRDPAIYSRCEIEHINSNKEFFRLSGKAATNPYGDRNLETETDIPFEVAKQLQDDVKAAYRQGKRPKKPDLQKMIKEAKDKTESGVIH